MHNRRILLASGLAVSVVLGLSTVIGGLFAWGFADAAAIVGIAVLVAVWKLSIDTRVADSVPSCLSISAFAGAEPVGLSDEQRSKITDLCRGSVFLLMFEQTRSGLWGKSYLFRRQVSGSGIPLSGGSLTGTPLSLTAIHSAGEIPTDDPRFRGNLVNTLSKLVDPRGNYIRRYIEGQVGRVADPEPLRHSAGGFLATLLLKATGEKDLRTLHLLIREPLGEMAWDRAIVARALLRASYESQFPRFLRWRARRRHDRIIREILSLAKVAPVPALTWADPYDYGRSANNQWATVWALLSSASDPGTAPRLKRKLRAAIRQLLLSQRAAIADENGLLPSSVDKSGNGLGTHVLGTAVAVLSWQVLARETFPGESTHDDQGYFRESFERVLSAWQLLLEQPSIFDEAQPLSIEGYFAWAALTLVCAAAGARVSRTEMHRFLDLCEDLVKLGRNHEDVQQLARLFQGVLRDSGPFDSDSATIVGRAAARIACAYATTSHAGESHAT